MNKIIVDAELTEPPSEVTIFRDLTLYAKTFLQYCVLVECQKDVTDLYWYWLKSRGAFDFVDDFVETGSESGVRINSYGGGIVIGRLTAENLNLVVSKLNSYHKKNIS